MKLTNKLRTTILSSICVSALTLVSCGSDSDNSNDTSSASLSSLVGSLTPYTIVAQYPGDEAEIYRLIPTSKTEGNFTSEYLFYGPGTTPDRGTGTYRWNTQPNGTSNFGEVVFDKEYTRTPSDGAPSYVAKSLMTLKMTFTSARAASGSSTSQSEGGDPYIDEGYTFTISPTSEL